MTCVVNGKDETRHQRDEAADADVGEPMLEALLVALHSVTASGRSKRHNGSVAGFGFQFV